MVDDKFQINNKQSGFTLIELLVAIMLIAIGLSAAAGMQAIALNGNSMANKASVASFLAQQVAEEISSRNITDPILTTGVTNVPYQFVDWSSGSQQIVSSLTITGAGTFSANYTINPNFFNGASLHGMTQIKVTVGNSTYTTYKMVL